MTAYLGALLPDAFGAAGSAGYAVVVTVVLMLALVGCGGVVLLRRRRHSQAPQDNPPSEPDGSKAQPPARGPRGRGRS